MSTTTDGNNGSGNNGATPTPTASGSNGSTGNTNAQAQSGSGEAFSAQSITVPDDYYIYFQNKINFDGQDIEHVFVKVNDFNKVKLTDQLKKEIYNNQHGFYQINSDASTIIDSDNSGVLNSRKEFAQGSAEYIKAKDYLTLYVFKDTDSFYVRFYETSGAMVDVKINHEQLKDLTDQQKERCQKSTEFVAKVGDSIFWYAPQQMKDYVHSGDWSKPFATGTSTNSSNNNSGNNNNNNNNNNDQTPGSNAVSTQGLNIGNNLFILAKNAGHLTRNDVFLKDGAQAHKDQLYGVYTVHVVKGQIQITKTIDSQYSPTQAIKANQSFVFRIDVYDPSDVAGPNGETATFTPGAKRSTFYETIAFSANEGKTTKTKLISNLPKGVYVVTEETDWSPKYNLQGTNGLQYNVGLRTGVDASTGEPTFTGVECFKYGQDKASITPYDQSNAKYIYLHDLNGNDHYANNQPAEFNFENNIKGNWKWLSDTAAAVNQFTN